MFMHQVRIRISNLKGFQLNRQIDAHRITHAATILWGCLWCTRDVRTIWAINAGAKDGYWPLLRPVKPSARIRQKFLVSQSSDGTIDVSSDYRDAFGDEYWFNPYHSPLPFAAYLIPPNLPIGARVYLSDLIEDIEAGRWNQGDSYRAQSGYAIWNGDSLELEQLSSVSFVG